MKTLTTREKLFGISLIVVLLTSSFFYMGYSFATSTLVVTPSNLVTLDSNGNIVISGNVTGASIHGGHFYWTNGTELGGGTSTSSSTWYNGTGVPGAGLGVAGDFFLRLDNGWVYNKIVTTWTYVANITGPQGIQGLQGVQGIQGPAGTNGSTWLSGSGAPGAVGVNGDYYFRTDNSWVYLKTTGTWNYIANLTGLPASSTTYYVNATAITGGTIANGTIASLYYYNNIVQQLNEGNGAAPLTFYMNFSGVASFDQIVIREYYLGSTSHNIKVQVYDYATSSWEDYYEFTGQVGYNVITIPCYDSSDHISGGLTQMRLYHVENGIASHRLYLDFAWLLKGNNVGASTNLAGFAKYLSGYNNFVGSGNTTANNFDSTQPMGAYSYMIYVDPNNSSLYNAKAANGTICWSSTNATTTIQNAINSVVGVGSVIIKEGVYPVTFLTMRGGVDLIGGSFDSSTIQATIVVPRLIDWRSPIGSAQVTNIHFDGNNLADTLMDCSAASGTTTYSFSILDHVWLNRALVAGVNVTNRDGMQIRYCHSLLPQTVPSIYSLNSAVGILRVYGGDVQTVNITEGSLYFDTVAAGAMYFGGNARVHIINCNIESGAYPCITGVTVSGLKPTVWVENSVMSATAPCTEGAFTRLNINIGTVSTSADYALGGSGDLYVTEPIMWSYNKYPINLQFFTQVFWNPLENARTTSMSLELKAPWTNYSLGDSARATVSAHSEYISLSTTASAGTRAYATPYLSAGGTVTWTSPYVIDLWYKIHQTSDQIIWFTFGSIADFNSATMTNRAHVAYLGNQTVGGISICDGSIQTVVSLGNIDTNWHHLYILGNPYNLVHTSSIVIYQDGVFIDVKYTNLPTSGNYVERVELGAYNTASSNIQASIGSISITRALR